MRSITFGFPFALMAGLVAGCSSSNTASNDAGTGGDTGHHPTADAGHDTGTVKHEAGTGHDGGSKDTGVVNSDAEPPGPAPAAGSTEIVKGLTEVIGISDDNQLIYIDGTTSALYALDYLTTPLPAPVQILAGSDAGATNGPEVGLNHNIVWVLSNYNAKNVGTVQIWSHAHPTLTTISSASTGVIAASNNSSAIVYTTGANAGGTIGNIEGANGDGSSPMPLVTNVDIDNTASSTCIGVALFDQAYAVVQACPIEDGGTTGPATITSFNSASSWAAQVLQTNSLPTTSYLHYTVDDAGLNALTIGQTFHDGGPATEQISIVPLATGSGPTLTANGGAPASTQIGGGVPVTYLNGSSTFALFSVFNNGFNIATFADPAAPVAIQTVIAPAVDGGAGPLSVGGLEAISPDGKWALTFGPDVDTSKQIPTSLYLQSLVPTAGAYPAPTSLSTGEDVYTLGFSADGTYLLYSTNATLNGIQLGQPNGGYVGTLKTVSLAAGATPVSINLAQSIWNATGTHGTKLIYNWNYQVAPYGTQAGGFINGSAYADIYSGDAATAAEGTVMVAQADANYYLSSDKSKIIYSFSHFAMSDGVYVVAAP